MTNGRGRRKFLQTLPLAAALPAAFPRVSFPQVSDTSGAEIANPQVSDTGGAEISDATLREAEKIAAVTFSDTERAGMIANVTANRTNYETLRAIDVADDVEPAFSFEPLARTRPAAPATPHAPLTVDRPRLATRPADDDLAFLPLTALAALIQSRAVSSAELTELYLARLKRFGPALECVVTLTEDL